MNIKKAKELTDIELTVLADRIWRKARAISEERLAAPKGIPFVTDYNLYDANGVECTQETKKRILEAAWREGMVEGIKLFEAFKEELARHHAAQEQFRSQL